MMNNLEMMANAGIDVKYLSNFENAPKYTVVSPYGEELELQEFPKVAGFKYRGWMVLHDVEGRVYVKDWRDNEVCRYDNVDVLDCEYAGSINVEALWNEFKGKLNHQNVLTTAWNKFPAKTSYADVKNWFEDEFGATIGDDSELKTA